MISRSLLISQLFGLMGTLCVALGIVGLVGLGGVLHPALAERSTAWTLLAGGAVLLVLELRILIPPLLERAKRQRDDRPR